MFFCRYLDKVEKLYQLRTVPSQNCTISEVYQLRIVCTISKLYHLTIVPTQNCTISELHHLRMPALAPDCGAQASIAISLHFPKPLRLMGTTSHCGAKERKAEIAGTWNGAKLPFSFTLPQPLRLWSSGRAKQGKTSLFLSLISFLCVL